MTKTKSIKALQALVDEGHRYLPNIVARLHRRYGHLYEYEELLSLGYEGLVAAARTFDPEKGIWKWYAVMRIEGHVQNHIIIEIDYQAKARAGAQRVAEQLRHDAEVADDVALHEYLDSLCGVMAWCGAGAASAKMATLSLDLEHAVDLRRLYDLVAEHVAALRPPDSIILELHYRKNVELKEIATQLGMGYSTVLTHHREALLRLGRRLRMAYDDSSKA